jgi:uncharacterized cofD-like protein
MRALVSPDLPARLQRHVRVEAGGPRIVAFGGGTGLPNVLRGLRQVLAPPEEQAASIRDRIVAIVATTDDGGSSGRLRTEFGIIPPGDIRNCLIALADDSAPISGLFQYRFGSGDGLNGHALGNLVLAALADVTRDFARAVDIASRVLDTRGTVLPATTSLVTLVADLADGREVRGETAISAEGRAIRRLRLSPERPRCLDAALDAIARADAIVAGPGSLYTSVLAPLLVPDIAAAVAAARAPRVFVMNLMTEPGETDCLRPLDHVRVLHEQLGATLFDCVIYNTSPIPDHLVADYRARGSSPIAPGTADLEALARQGVLPLGLPLFSEQPAGRIRHHPERLATALAAIARGRLATWRASTEPGDA